MPARGYSTNRQLAVNRATAVGRAASVGRLSVQGTASADDMIFIASIALDSVQTFSAIPGSYRHLEIFWTAKGSTAGAKAFQVILNSDGGANYNSNFLAISGGGETPGSAAGASILRVGRIPGSDGAGFASGVIELPYYATTTQRKAIIGNCQSPEVDDAGGNFTEVDTGSWTTANAAITAVTFSASAGVFAANSVASLYGIT